MSPTREAGGGAVVVRGLPMAPGLAVGTPVFHTEHDVDVPVRPIAPDDVPAEQRRLAAALREARRLLEAVEKQIEEEVGASDARIFSVQQLLLEDPSFRKGLRARIKRDLVNAEVAVRDEVAEWGARLAGVGAGSDRDPAADLRDVGRQVLRLLVGQTPARVTAGDGDEQFVLVTRELLPSDAASVDRLKLAAIVTGAGGLASHAAILARSLGIPAVTDVDVTALPARGGAWIVDGTAGTVTLNPGRKELSEAQRRSRDYLRFRSEQLAEARGLATTADGAAVEVLLNVENFETLPAESLDDMRGIGLYRTEFVFLHRDWFPSEEEQFQHYVGAIRKVRDREITFRTIDVGGDKPLSYLSMPGEPNPVLGWRGLRLSLEWPDMFYAQLRALLRASAHGRIRVLLPMVTMVEEFRRARQIVREIQSDLRARGVPFDPRLQVGAMIEVPAAALAARALAAEADFLSIGTNDLTQYALAVDRNNARVAGLFQPFHPGVIELLRLVVAAADAAGTPVSLCGEMAGDPQATLLLLGLGLRSLSVSPYRVPLVKKVVTSTTIEDAVRVAQAALAMNDTAEIAAYLRQQTLQRVPRLEDWLPPAR
ncbi:MAG TPA: phosphoenolpyruvate--protein phosphotransferase [Planctomycetota bacterium]|nr:phosphoenolpyruvate--protein phosphotransferase [Planctomycetota bacterium]